MSCAYGHLLMLNHCSNTLTWLEKRKRAAKKENGSYHKIVRLLTSQYYRFLAYLYASFIYLSIVKLKKKIK